MGARPPGPPVTTAEPSGAGVRAVHDGLRELERVLDLWRHQIDELLLQLDLADLDSGVDARAQIGAARDAYRAARARLSGVRTDSGASLVAVHRSVEMLLRDLQRAYAAAADVLRRLDAAPGTVSP